MSDRSPASVTVSWKVSVCPSRPTAGATKVVTTASGAERVTGVPAIWDQRWAEMLPSGSEELEASRVTVAPSAAL